MNHRNVHLPGNRALRRVIESPGLSSPGAPCLCRGGKGLSIRLVRGRARGASSVLQRKTDSCCPPLPPPTLGYKGDRTFSLLPIWGPKQAVLVNRNPGYINGCSVLENFQLNFQFKVNWHLLHSF